MKILVGTGGAPISSRERNNFSGVERIRELGLDAMEVEFTYGVRMGKETAEQLGEHARKFNVSLSVHGPYYINLNSKEAKKIKDSEQRILDTAEKAHLFGGDKVVFHPGFYSGRSSEDAFQTFYQEINDLLEIVEERGFNVHLSPETTGKKSQFGSLDEIIELCRRLPDLRMTIDFAHLFAREQGNIDFHKCLEKIENNLGTEFLKDMHMHFSGIEYTDKGERRHLTADDPKNHLKYEDIAAVLRDFDVHGNLICESPNLEVDALKMKKLLEIA